MKDSRTLQKLSLKSRGFLRNNSATILTTVGAIGVVGTAVLTAKATTKANDILEEATIEKGEKLTVKEKIVVAGPSYIPAILMGTVTVSCIFAANVLNKRHQAALVSAYTMLDQSYKQYQSKVEEFYGEGSNENIKNEIAKDEYKKVSIRVDDGKELFYDDYSKRYFESTKEKVKQAEYTLNRNLVMRDYAYLNEWYDELDLDLLDEGYKLGWTMGQCMDMYWQPWIDFTHSKIELDDGRECNVIRMMEEPRGFKEFFDSRAGECTDGLYPTVTIRQIMWALKIKPMKRERWETCFDRRNI